MRARGRAAAAMLCALAWTACGGSGGQEGSGGSSPDAAAAGPNQDAASGSTREGAAALAHNGAAEVPAGLDPEGGVTFVVEAKGDLDFRHSGGALCEVYQDELLISFLQTDDLSLGYELRVADFAGEGSYDGALTLERNDRESTGPVKLAAELREGDLLPVLTGTFSGSVDGPAGSASLEGTFQCKTDLGDPSAAVANPTGAWIEYEVTGDASANAREDEVMICSRGEGGVLMARSVGAWVIGVETENSGFGPSSAAFTVSPPSHLRDQLVESGDPRFRGRGTVTVEESGTDAYGLPAVKVDFQAQGLTAGSHTLDVRGTFRCGVMQ